MPYVNERWLGGLLTNFVTVRKSLDRIKELEMMSGRRAAGAPHQEGGGPPREGAHEAGEEPAGIKGMKTVPDAVFVIDTRKEAIAVQEARKLKIPVVGIVDTNCDPDEVDYVIPGNDDALRAIKLFAGRIADAVLAGRGLRESRAADAAAADKGAGAAGGEEGDGGVAPPSEVAPADAGGPRRRPDVRKPHDRTTPRARGHRGLRSSVSLRAWLKPLAATEALKESTWSITAEMVRKLREETGAGMMDCKTPWSRPTATWTRRATSCARRAWPRRQEGGPHGQRRHGRPLHPPRLEDRRPGRGQLRDRLRGQDAGLPVPGEGHRHAHRGGRPRAALRGKDEVPAEVLEKEKEIYRAQAAAAGKPRAVVDKIAEGKLKDYYSTFCLLEQPFVRTPS